LLRLQAGCAAASKGQQVSHQSHGAIQQASSTQVLSSNSMAAVDNE
jgi:hypothetical protein